MFEEYTCISSDY